jgi:hypothetical protein
LLPFSGFFAGLGTIHHHNRSVKYWLRARKYPYYRK